MAFGTTISTSSPLISSEDNGDTMPVDLGADAGVADIGVHGIGEIDGVAPRGSAISFPFGVKQNT